MNANDTVVIPVVDDGPPVGRAEVVRGGATLAASDVSAWFGPTKVLDLVSLTMRCGTVTALIGPSGCGKSTFLRSSTAWMSSCPPRRSRGGCTWTERTSTRRDAA